MHNHLDNNNRKQLVHLIKDNTYYLLKLHNITCERLTTPKIECIAFFIILYFFKVFTNSFLILLYPHLLINPDQISKEENN